MVFRMSCVAAMVTAGFLSSVPAVADEAITLREKVTPQFAHALPNAEGKNLVAVIVEYPPGAKSLPHHHALSAFVYAYVMSGTVRSQIGQEPAKNYHQGEGFFELPGAHHQVSENASNTEPAKMLVVFVVDTGEKLTIPDPQ